MSSQKHILDELKAFESSLPFNNSQLYSVPEGYFEGLATAVLAKVKSSEASIEAELGELSPLLARIPKVTPYSVPFSYFQENIETVPAFMQETDSPALPYLGKELPYNVPQGYFENLATEVLNRVSKPPTRVVPLFARGWMRVASAAVVSGALFFAGLQLFRDKTEGPEMAGNPPDTTQTQVAQNKPAIEKGIKQASTRELEEFVETVQVNGRASGDMTNSEKEVEELLRDVSINEIESFLSALPTDDDLLITD